MPSSGTDSLNCMDLDEWMEKVVLDSVEDLVDTDNVHDKVEDTLEN